MSRFVRIVLWFATCLLTLSSLAQQPVVSSVPNLIRYGGTLKNPDGAAISSTTVGVTFAIYKQQDGGAPIWQETQSVTTDANGAYTVLLGSTTATGLPDDLFSQQEQRWLGVQLQGQAEQARVLLVSVPYAFKAGEAEKLAGHSASEFVTTDNLQSAVQQQLQQQSGATASANAPAGSGTNSKTANQGAPANGPTNFSGSTSDQIVGVTQSGTGAGVGASSATNAVVGTATGAGGVGLNGTATGAGGVGVWGFSVSKTGNGAGVRGYVDSPTGTAGVFQSAGGGNILRGVDKTGTTVFSVDGKGNVLATTADKSGVGITGNATDTGGATNGVKGMVASPFGAGVLGISTAIPGLGVYGAATMSKKDMATGSIGVAGTAADAYGRGVVGMANNYGVVGTAQGNVGKDGPTAGVRGEAYPSGNPAVFGAEGVAVSVNGIGVFGCSDTSTVTNCNQDLTAGPYGVEGVSKWATGGGVLGIAASNSGNNANGVLGQTKSESDGAAGVRGDALGVSGQVYGVFGKSASADGAGGIFQSLSTDTSAKILVAEDHSGTQRFTVDASGNASVTVGTTPLVTVSLPVNHARLTFMTADQNDYHLVTLNWAFAFPDTNYTATCTPQASDIALWFFQIYSTATDSVTLQYAGYHSEQLTIHCTAVHD